MSAPPLQDPSLVGMSAHTGAQGGAVPFPKRSMHLLSQSRLITDGTAHHFILCSPAEAVDMAAVQRQCSVSTPKGAEGVTLYHAPYSGGSGRRVVAVSVPISLAASSVLAMELLKKRLFAWEDELNASFGAMDEDDDPSGSGDAAAGRQQVGTAAAGTSTAASVSLGQPMGHQQVAPASGSAVDATAGTGAGGGPVRAHPGPTTVTAPQGMTGAPNQPSSGGQRPTLFNLLEALASDSVTTPDQRNSIRGIVTDFLNHDLPHSKVYSFIGAVVGHDVLHTIVRKLENEPGRLGVPDAGGLARIEKAFGLSKTTNQQPAHSPQPSGRKVLLGCNAGFKLVMSAHRDLLQ